MPAFPYTTGAFMRRLAAVFPLLFAAVLLLILPHAAEAKRLGFGGNMGKQYSAPQRSGAAAPATMPRQSTATPTVATTPRQSGASRWLGPLAGLVAGGLIASMLFGDGFEGLQLLDFLLIAALVFGAMTLFRAMRPRAVAQAAGGPAFAGGFGAGVAAPAYTPAGSGAGDVPAWFNGESFLKGARVHFIRLQAAWDKGDMKDIATYTTPELFAELQAERLARGSETHYTDVGYLDVELVGMQRDGDQVVSTIRFFGGIKEEQEGETQEFAELWHVVHAWDRPEGDWYVAGIQQV
jgi:predicted lipid-binding transport protein (Tim44 family)